MISASEDIGLAVAGALGLAVAAAQSVALVGIPEARIILAEAVTYLATAPNQTPHIWVSNPRDAKETLNS